MTVAQHLVLFLSTIAHGASNFKQVKSSLFYRNIQNAQKETAKDNNSVT